MIGISIDVTAHQRSEERLAHLAYHDALTGLPNRRNVEEQLGRDLARARREHDAVAVPARPRPHEGIETAARQAFAAAAGCQYGQGFHLARPMPAGEVTALFAATSSRVPRRRGAPAPGQRRAASRPSWPAGTT